MRRSKIAFIFIICSLLVFPFVNCGGPNDIGVMEGERLSSVCANGGCIANETLLELSITNSESGFNIASNVDRFYVSGECNNGGFEDNIISWRIVSNDQELNNSNSAGGDEFFSRCTTGQYSLTVKLPCPGITNNGSTCYGLKQNSVLEVEIFGSQDGQFFKNPNSNLSRKAANLFPSQ